MNAKERNRRDWISTTQMFQRIAGQPEESDEVLGAAWDELHKKKSKAKQQVVIDNLNTHITIAQVARKI